MTILIIILQILSGCGEYTNVCNTSSKKRGDTLK